MLFKYIQVQVQVQVQTVATSANSFIFLYRHVIMNHEQSNFVNKLLGRCNIRGADKINGFKFVINFLPHDKLFKYSSIIERNIAWGRHNEIIDLVGMLQSMQYIKSDAVEYFADAFISKSKKIYFVKNINIIITIIIILSIDLVINNNLLDQNILCSAIQMLTFGPSVT
jgi:hypothetical protein